MTPGGPRQHAGRGRGDSNRLSGGVRRRHWCVVVVVNSAKSSGSPEARPARGELGMDISSRPSDGLAAVSPASLSRSTYAAGLSLTNPVPAANFSRGVSCG